MKLIRPMLAKVYHPKRYQKGMLVQPKLNGVRMLCQGEYLVSRGTGKDEGVLLTSNRFQHIRSQLHLLPKNVIWDGELYIHGESLQKINARVSYNSPNVQTNEDDLEYHIFDYVSREPAYQRLAYLSRLSRELQGVDTIRFVPTYVTQSELESSRHYLHFKSAGYEGMMYRVSYQPYAIPGEHRRSSDNRVDWLLKRKDWLDLDATIIGLEEGEGKCAETLGSFRLKWNNVEFSAGSGPTDLERAIYWRHGRHMLGCACKIKYELLSDDGIPVKPVIIQVELPK